MELFEKLPDFAKNALKKINAFLGEGDDLSHDSFSSTKKARESLRFEVPSFRALLPYETINEKGIFFNKKSRGFGLSLSPLAGADESLVKSLAELIKNKLPLHVDAHFMLYKHHYLSNRLAKSFVPLLEKGGIYAELSKMSIQYHLNAIKEGYKNGCNVPAGLSDYCCYVFISSKHFSMDEGALSLLREDFEAEFKVAGMYTNRLDKKSFLTLMSALTSPKPSDIEWPSVDNESDYLSHAINHPSTMYDIDDRKIAVSCDNEMGDEEVTHIVNCEITEFPKKNTLFGLWQTPDLFANLLKQQYGIHCPFLISFVIRGASQERVKSKAKSRASSLNSNSNHVQAFMNPSMIEEGHEWNFVHQEASKDNLKILPTFYNLMLFTTKDKEREHVAKAISAYRQMGFTLQRAKCKQWLRYLGSLPFVLTEDLYNPYSILGLIKPLTHFNVTNLLPIVADFKGSNEGMLLPTYRNQLFFYNPFDDARLPITNFNRLTVASTGSGKSFFQLGSILDGLSRNHKIFVIDIGGSYKHLCQLVGGTYIDAQNLTLNPFTLFDFEGVTNIEGKSVRDYVQIRDLLAIMASPNEPLSDVQRSWLLTAVLKTWERHGKHSSIDTVLDILAEMLAQPNNYQDLRLKDLIVLLEHFGTKGAYGHMFNAQTPLFNDSNFVVLEMKELKDTPELLKIVMFVMIVIIQGQFYHSDRRIFKQCIIDEAWEFLGKGSNPIAAKFIEQGFRTARKHNGGFTVITQNLIDTHQTIQGQAIEAASDAKIIMRQGNFEEFVTQHPDTFNGLEQKMIHSFGEAKIQGFSSLMIKFGKGSTFHRYFSDPFSRILFSTSGEEFGEVDDLVSQGYAIGEAVRIVAEKTFGDEL